MVGFGGGSFQARMEGRWSQEGEDGGRRKREGGCREKTGESDCCDKHPRQPPPLCFYLFYPEASCSLFPPFFKKKNPFSLLHYPIFLISTPVDSFWDAPVTLPALLLFSFAALCFPFFLACFFSTSIGESVRWGLNLAFSSHSICLISSYFIFTFRSWLSLPSLACWNNNHLHQRWRGAPDTRCTFPPPDLDLDEYWFLTVNKKGKGEGGKASIIQLCSTSAPWAHSPRVKPALPPSPSRTNLDFHLLPRLHSNPSSPSLEIPSETRCIATSLQTQRKQEQSRRGRPTDTARLLRLSWGFVYHPHKPPFCAFPFKQCFFFF